MYIKNYYHIYVITLFSVADYSLSLNLSHTHTHTHAQTHTHRSTNIASTDLQFRQVTQNELGFVECPNAGGKVLFSDALVFLLSQ